MEEKCVESIFISFVVIMYYVNKNILLLYIQRCQLSHIYTNIIYYMVAWVREYIYRNLYITFIAVNIYKDI